MLNTELSRINMWFQLVRMKSIMNKLKFILPQNILLNLIQLTKHATYKLGQLHFVIRMSKTIPVKLYIYYYIYI